MPNGPLSEVIQNLPTDLGPDGDGVTDGELLARFVRSRDEGALAALVRRHARMVWGVCRRLLNHHEAEDAFQATFLVLVRKATSVPEQTVANWLYGVARQTAVRVRATAAKRGRRETQALTVPEPTVPEVREADVTVAVDEELSRLPGHYRGVIVLCGLEGMTRKDAARQLGIPEGSVASRLARARAMLAKRLARRGVALSGGALMVLSGSASASAPPALVATTIRTASLLAAGPAAGVVSAKAAALTDGVVKAMFATKIKSVLAVVLIAGLAVGGIALGVGLSTNPVAVAQAETPTEAPVKKDSPAPPVVPKKEEKPLHFVEKPDMKPQFAWLPHKVEGEVTEEDIYVASKGFIADICLPGKIRLRDFIDPRYLKKHGLTDRDIAYEILDHQGLNSYQVADDLRTILFQVDAKGGGKELIIVRWVAYEGRLYISPEKAPDPKTGIFKPWILRTKVK